MTRVCAVIATLCMTLQTVRCQQQRFRVRPSNVSVVEGDSAILRCEVQHQVGQLQWAKDGFALGYSRSLPGYDRYRMLGEPGSGVHDLEITNVTLEDDGRFQCQVSPNRGQDAIRADAILTVLVRPASIELVSAAESPSEGVYEVAADAGDLSLSCDVRGARPAAQVRWQRNGEDIRPDRKDSFSGWGHPGRNDTTSVVTLRPTAADDGAGFSCVALHPAIQAEDQQKLNATVRLSVLHPPGAPEISGYTEGEVVSIGQQKTLTCISRGGNPPAQLVWLKNGRPIGSRYRQEAGRTLAELTVQADASNMNATLHCRATSRAQSADVDTYVIVNVLFGPEKITVSGTQKARAGDTVHMSCITSSSNPSANITWVINGITMNKTHQVTSESGDGGYISRSNISTAVPQGMEHDMTVACYGLNPALGLSKVGSANVTVLHPPDPPSILGYEPGTQLRSGERVSLSCVSQGGNPPATLTWYRDDTELAASTEVHDSVARSVVTFQVDHTDNGRAYTCRSTNSEMAEAQSAIVKLAVLFPPAGLSVEVRPEVLRSGSAAILTCESRPSYPAADLTWWRDNVHVTDSVTALETFKAGKQGGFSSRLSLRKNVTSSDDGTTYECRCNVSELSEVLQEKIMLNVSYPPEFGQTRHIADIQRGSSLRLNLTAKGHPGDITYQWSRESRTDGSTGARPPPTRGPLLDIRNATRADAGWYRLMASNSVGNATVSVHVNVQYAPELVSVPSTVVVAPGGEAVLDCAADANPLPTDLVSWVREDFHFDSSRVSVTSGNGSSVLVIRNVTSADAGQFQCRAANDIGQVNATATLLVEHEPELLDSARFSKSAASTGEEAQLTCRARGTPNVTFEWSQEGTDIDTEADTEKYSLAYSQVDLVTWQSVLRVADVQPSDYATYLCVAHNELGSQQQQIVLDRPSAPDPPLGLQVVNVSHDSATVAWQPGFDGGQQQRFRVRHKEADGGGSRSLVDDVPSSSGTMFNITGLRANTEYTVSVMAYNALGESSYARDVTVTTADAGSDAGGAAPQPAVLGETAQLPWIVIIAVSSVGALLLVVNVALVIFFIRRRMRRSKQPKKMVESASSETSTKSEMLHMYGNETVSTISVKSSASRDDIFLDNQFSDGRQPADGSAPVRSRSSDVFRFRSERVPGRRGSPPGADGRRAENGSKLHRSTSSCTPTRDLSSGGESNPFVSYRGRPDLVPSGPPDHHSPVELDRCVYTPPSSRPPPRERTPPPEQLLYTPPASRAPGRAPRERTPPPEQLLYTPPAMRGRHERTPPPEQLLYTPPAERCVFPVSTQPRSAAIKQLATFGGRASPPPPPPPPAGHPLEEAGMLV